MKIIFTLVIALIISSFSFSQTISNAAQQSFCGAGTKVLTAVGVPPATTIQWEFSATGSAPWAASGSGNSITATAVGFYRIFTAPPPVYYDTVELVQSPAPSASFTFDNNICSGLNVQFTPTVNSGTAPYSYAWNFGDATTSTLQSPTHAYTSFGCSSSNFTTILTVTDALGCTASVSNSVIVKQKPEISLTDIDIFSPFSNCDQSPTPTSPNFTLTVNNSSVNLSCLTSFTINWGDGNIQTNPSFPATHIYTTLAAFNLVISAVATNGCTNTKTYIVANQSNPDIGIATYGPTVGCASQPVNIIITTWQANSPGTLYSLNYGDGNIVNLTHPINTALTNDTINHIYTTSPCPNSPTFQLKITATNACKSKSFIGGDIEIRTKPQADFSILPNPSCVGQSICFTNLTQSGFYINCSTTTLSMWDFGDPASGSNNTSTAASPCHTYATPGVYTVTLTSSNPCGPSTKVKTVCINALLVPSFTIDNNAGCALLNLNTTNTTNNTANCSAPTYLWTVSYAASNCGTSSGYVFTGGTTSTSSNPSFQFTNSGTYTINLTASNPCGPVTTSKTVVIKKPPTVNIVALASQCGSASVNPVANITNCGNTTPTYAWSFPGGTPSTSSTLAPGSISYSTPGTYAISLAVTNECGTTTATSSILIKEVPIATVPATVQVCAGVSVGPLSFTSSIAGSTFSWTNSNTAIGLAASGSSATIPVFTATNNTASQITGNINVTVSNNGCTSSSSFQIKVDPLPVAPLVTTPVNYCVGQAAVPLSATALGSNILNWYTTSSGGVASSTAPTPLTTAGGTTIYYVSQSTPVTLCESPRVPITVNVYAIPTITATKTNPTTCSASNGTIIISGLTTGSIYTVSYIKNSGSPTVQNYTAVAPGRITIPNLTEGTYTNIFVILNGCTSNIEGPLVLSDPTQPSAPTASNNSPICSGNSLTLSASAVVNATYTWTGPNGFTNTTQNPSILNATVAASGTYSVTVTVAGCTSPAATTIAVVNPTPITPTVTSNSPICNGENILLTATSTAGATYSWSGPNGFTSTTQNPTITNATLAAGGIYTVIATLGTCTNTAPTTVIVKPVPVITVTKTDPLTCSSSTGTIIISGLTTGSIYTVSYIKNSGSPTVQNYTAVAPGRITIPNLTEGTYTNIFVILNGCTSNIEGPLVLSDPTQPSAPTASNNSPICSGNSLTLSASAVVNATYTWTGPNGFTNTTQNPSILNATVAASGTYSVTVTVAGCTSPAATTIAVVNPTPITPTVTSNSPICNGENILLTATSTAGATYSWSGPNGFTSTTQNPTITNATLAAGGIYTVIATLGTCTNTAPTTVIVKPVPVITVTKTDPLTCSSSTGSITISGLVTGNSYTVSYIKNGAAPTVQTLVAVSGNIVLNLLSQGTYTNIFVILNGCASNIEGPLVLSDPNPPPAPTANSNAPICRGFNLTLNATTTATGIANYNWTGPNGFTSNLQSPTITNTTLVNAGNYFVTVTINNCVSPPATLPVVINDLPVAPLATTPVTYCIDNIATALTATISTAGNTLNWYTLASGGTASSTAPVPSTVTAGATNYYVSQTTSQGCEGARTQITVQVNPNAIAVFTPTTIISCPSFTITPAIVGLQTYPANNSSYSWYANGILIGTGTIFPGYTITNQHDSVLIKLVTTSILGCKSDSMQKKFFTYKLPVPSFTKNTALGCAPLSVSFTNTTPDIADYTYDWNFGNGQTSTLAQPAAVIYQNAATFIDTFYVITLKVISVCGTLTFKDSVFVKSKPKALFTPDDVNGCSPMKVTFTNTSLGIGNSYFWNFDDGQTFTTTSRDTFSHIFYTGVIDTFYVKLVVTNACGKDSITYAIITAPNTIQLNFALNGTSQYGCAPHIVAFYNNSVGAGSFIWNFGDGGSTTTVNNIDTVYHTYNLPGVFTVSVNATNNCSDTTAFKYITVYAKPTPAFTANNYTVCIGQQVQFTDGSTGATAWQWQFGDGTFSAIPSPAHTYNTPGTYTVKLIVRNTNPSGNVCVDSTTRAITVVAVLPGNTTVSGISSPCAPFTVTFTNLTTPAVSINWNYGDGQTGTGNIVTHTYNVAGVYVATCNVIVAGGCSYQTTHTITVGGPAGTFQYSAGYVCYPSSAFFQASATNANSYFWQFGDGTSQTTTTSSTFHQYANPGAYIPSVTLQNTGGCNVLLPGTVPVRVDKIDGGFSYNQLQVCGSTTINFADTSHAFFGTATVKWNYGDSQTGVGALTTHTYNTSGTYIVEMVVIGNSGCTDTTRKQLMVFVKSKPTVSIIAPATKCALQNVLFTANINSTDDVIIKDWLLSNGATATGNTFTYNFILPGTYNVRFIAGTVNGCFDTTNHTIIIKAVPTVTASGPITLCLGNTANISVTGNAATYQWNPIQGLSCTACTNPLVSAIITTAYVVVGTNTIGCTASDTVVVTIIQPLQINTSPEVSICVGQSTQLQASGAQRYVWNPGSSLSDSTISNPIANPATTTIYRVIAYDGQNCFTDTAFVTVNVGQYPIVSLGPDVVLAAGTQHPLTTVIVNGPIQQWLWTPSTNISCTTCPLPIASIKKDISYTVKVTNVFGCSANDTINIKVFCAENQVFIPNAFSPDADGINDVIFVQAKGIVTVKHFRIFDRWGILIFERDNFQPNNIAFGWNGRVNGKPLPPDVFVYTAEVICENGSLFTYKGNISLIK